ADADAGAVELGAAALGGSEFLVLHRIHDHGVLELAALDAGHGNRAVGNPGNEVAGAVDGVDDPDRVRVLAFDASGFLAQEAVLGIGLAQALDEDFLHLPVDVGDEVVLTLFEDAYAVRTGVGLDDQGGSLARGTQGDVDDGMHVNLGIGSGWERAVAAGLPEAAHD